MSSLFPVKARRVFLREEFRAAFVAQRDRIDKIARRLPSDVRATVPRKAIASGESISELVADRYALRHYSERIAALKSSR